MTSHPGPAAAVPAGAEPAGSGTPDRSAGTGRAGGPPRHPRCLLTLSALVIALAILVVIGGPLLSDRLVPDVGPPGPVRFALAAGLVMLAHLARLRIRLENRTVVSVAWGEAALVVGLVLVPPGWLPLATLLGVGAALLLINTFMDRMGPLRTVRNAASITLATAAAAMTAALVTMPYGAELTPPVAAGMMLGATVYLLVSVGLAVTWPALRGSQPLPTLLRRILQGKLLMFVGNVVVGLVAIALAELDPRWLILLPPALWLLQQTYLHRLRADEERRSWLAFSRATEALNQLDEAGVAVAGARGVLGLAGAAGAEVVVLRPSGHRRSYHVDASGEVAERDLPDGTGPVLAGGGAEAVAVRPLEVGGAPVGEIRVAVDGGAQLPARVESALSAFGHALGAALHDAATHQELRVVTARASHDAMHDPLTGLANRAALVTRGDAALRTRQRDAPVAVLLLDINHFKEVNDTLGHAAGDELLRTIAARLGAQCRPGELLARLNGDEFAMLLPDPSVAPPPPTGEPWPAGEPPVPAGHRSVALTQAMRRARALTAELAAPTTVSGVLVSVEASVGVEVVGAGHVDMNELLRRAEFAMYQAKRGGASITWYDSDKDAASTDRLALLAEMREALAADDQLILMLQPAVNLVTGGPTGAEALVRWRHPRRGLLKPGDFVRTVEGSDLLGPFTRYVVDRALTVAADWARQGLDVPIAVNLSPRSLLDPDLPAGIADQLRRHQVPPHRLVLEITETVVMSELEIIDQVLAGLRELGVQLAVDDFGTGYSSLTFLTRISVDELKVDRHFVAGMGSSPEAAAIVRTTVDLARELNLRVVAEGVETAAQRTALTELGCTAAQGFHFFRPMPAEHAVTALHALVREARAPVIPLRADGTA